MRTFPVSADGRWRKQEAKGLYALVATTHEVCIAQIRYRARFTNVSPLTQRMAVSGSVRFRVLKINKDDPMKADDSTKIGGIYALFPGGLGHHLGLDVHDMATIDS